MKLEQMLPTDETEKSCIWDVFRAEERLWDIEAELLEDLRYYNHRLETIGQPATTADQALLTIYKNHIRRIKGLLSRLPSQHDQSAYA